MVQRMRARPTLIPRLLVAVAVSLTLACGPGRGGDLDASYGGVSDDSVIVDPSGYAPLTAVIELETESPVSIVSRVIGRNGPSSDVRHALPTPARKHRVEVLGLYPARENTVELTFYDAGGVDRGTKSYTVRTAPLSARLPSIVVDRADPARMAPGMTLIAYFPHGRDGNTPQLPLFFDHFGDIRWYLDYTGHPQLGNLSYDVGIERLANGNLYFGDKGTNRIYEVTMLGEIVETWEMPGYRFHHNVQEKPDGNFLVTVTKADEPTSLDHIIEIDRHTGKIIRVWDLRRSLNASRAVFGNDERNWAHVNAVIYDERDDSIILTARLQGAVKLTASNEPVWILGPHVGWGTSGQGEDLSRVLLTPLDSRGEPIDDDDVTRGRVATDDFDWAWMPHAPQLMPDGTLMLFDNGARRHLSPGARFSRAVVYTIDEQDLTVQQVWAYGQERGDETYSVSVSDVDFLPESNHVIFAPGNSHDESDRRYGMVIELDYETREVLFEARITMPGETRGITFHRAERLPLHPDGVDPGR